EEEGESEKSSPTKEDAPPAEAVECKEAPAEDDKKEEDISAPSPKEESTTISTTNRSEVVQDDEKPSTSTGITANGTHDDKEGEEELSNLELAWEVLEIAKLGYQGQLKAVDKKLAAAETDEEKTNILKSKVHLQKRLSEAHSLLGEVATESETYTQAVD